jgi:hypothetical protein
MEKQPGFFRRRYKEILLTFTGLLTIFIFGTMWYNSTHEINPEIWFTFWKYCMFFLYFTAFPVVLWFIIGGIFDLKKLFRILDEKKMDEEDDGYIRKQDKAE